MTMRTPADRAMSDELPVQAQIDTLREQLAEANETLRAIRAGEVDAVIVHGDSGDQVYTLQSAEQPYRMLVEQMREGAAILTRHGDILYCNRRFADLIGLPLERVIGRSIERFVGEADREALAAHVGGRGGAHRGRLIAHDGRSLDVYLSLTVTVSEGIERRSLIVTDLTDLVDAEAERDRARHENRAKDEFMAMLAHELRNPLGAIGGAVQVLDLLGAHQEGPAIRARGVILRQVQHLARLIDDLLDVGRLATGKIVLARQPVDLADLVRHSVAAIVAERRLGNQLETSTQPVWIDADPTRVEQIISNLLANAVKYTQPGGLIRVSVTTEGQEAVLRVEDDGAGISPDLLPHIFDLFVQGQQTLDRARGGLGIGLTLVRRLVELHGASVEAVSDGPGCGSVFTVRFPSSCAPEQATPIHTPATEAVKRRVLIVEDNAESRNMYRLALELAGHDVLEAEDGMRGLEMLKSAQPDVAFIDLGLPALDGYELVRRFRAETNGRDVLLIALTGYGSSDDRERSREAGFDYHLIKPLSREALRDVLSGERPRMSGPARQ
ncbi:MAG: ATP-binding protein [Actinomycetes bacterium]